MMKPASTLEARIRDVALAFPDATEDFPWGERAIKVKGKVFLFMRGDRESISLSVKLPSTHFQALALTFTAPTGYGLGRSGWVTAKFPASNDEMLEQCREWLDESYRAVAPKKLVASLDGAGVPALKQSGPRSPVKRSGKPGAARKQATRKRTG